MMTGLPVDDGVADRMYLKRSSDAGNGAVAGFCHCTFNWRAARMAFSSRSHTTAT